jgi:hypothetical protein
MKTNLNIATQNLYSVFKTYAIKGNLRDRSCDCCVSDDEIKMLLSKDLHELSEDEIGHFMRSAITTFGEIEDYKHFLPRIFELMQLPKSEILDDFITFEKLNYSKWKTWEANEIEAIENYIMALWNETINNETSEFYKLQEVLSIMITYVSWEKALSIWEEVDSTNSIHYIVDAVLGDFYLDFDEEIVDNLMDWFSTEVILSKIEKVFFETEDEFEANRISIAYTIREYLDPN